MQRGSQLLMFSHFIKQESELLCHEINKSNGVLFVVSKLVGMSKIIDFFPQCTGEAGKAAGRGGIQENGPV